MARTQRDLNNKTEPQDFTSRRSSPSGELGGTSVETEKSLDAPTPPPIYRHFGAILGDSEAILGPFTAIMGQFWGNLSKSVLRWRSK